MDLEMTKRKAWELVEKIEGLLDEMDELELGQDFYEDYLEPVMSTLEGLKRELHS
tara:strand:+ start:118 stop:282 length:165 start_codon:yes stop_codon:yes gene_type:complete